MAYAVVVSACFAAGATVVQSLVRSSLPGTRFIWALALAGSLGFVAVAPARLQQPGALAPSRAVVVEAPSGGSVAMELPMSLVERAAYALPAGAARALGWAWAASSVVMLALLALSYRRHRRRIAGASREVLHGTAVRISESLGPAVVGVWRPDIVVPRWLLARAQDEQAMVVRHERSHVEVGDPALLMAGCATVALMPWNPGAWYLLARLRLAIEVDCDRRVLRAGAPTRAYGSLLIELTSALPAARVGAPAFACRPTHLERRLVAMTARPLSHRRARILAAAGVAALAFLGACETALPTATEVEQMGVAEVEERVMPALNLDPANVTYLLNGKVVERATVMALPGESITNVEVSRKDGVSKLYVSTGEPGDAAGEAELTRRRAVEEALAMAEAGVKQPLLVERVPGKAVILRDFEIAPSDAKKPLLIIDGVLLDGSETKRIKPDEIETVEVMKGAAARELYGERAADGVITLTTKQLLLRDGERFKTTIQMPSKSGVTPLVRVTPDSSAKLPAAEPTRKP